MSGNENPYSRSVETHIPTPKELALMSTPYSSDFQERVQENTQKIRERRAMKEALQNNSPEKQD